MPAPTVHLLVSTASTETTVAVDMRASPLAFIIATSAAAALLPARGGSSKTTSTRAPSAAGATAKLQAPRQLNPPAPAAHFALRGSRGELLRLPLYRRKAVLPT